MAKTNPRKKKYSVDKKFARDCMRSCDTSMKNIKKLIGKPGDGAANAKTLYGAMERYNDAAQNGATLTTAYDNFNKKTLKAIRSELAKIDKNIENID